MTRLIARADGVIIGALGKPLKAWDAGRGYLVVQDLGKNYKVHRLVAEQHVPNPHGYTEVHHIDENKLNNDALNLMWVSRSYNMECSTSKTYEFIDPSGEIRKIFNLSKFCKGNDLQQPNMLKVFKGERKHHKGWTKYV